MDALPGDGNVRSRLHGVDDEEDVRSVLDAMEVEHLVVVDFQLRRNAGTDQTVQHIHSVRFLRDSLEAQAVHECNGPGPDLPDGQVLHGVLRSQEAAAQGRRIDAEQLLDPPGQVRCLPLNALVGQQSVSGQLAAGRHKGFHLLQGLGLDVGAGREQQHLVLFALDAEFSVLDGALVCQHVLIQIVKVHMQTQQAVRHCRKVIFNGVADLIPLFRHIVGPDGVQRVEHGNLGHMVAAGQGIAHPGHVVVELAVLLPPGELIEHGRRPIPFPLSFHGIVEAMGNKLVHAQHIFPVCNPLHPLHSAVPVGAAHGFTAQTDGAVLVSSRGGNFQRNVLIFHLPGADSGIQMVNARHVELGQMLEKVAVHPAMEPHGLLIEQMSGEHHVVFLAPVVDLTEIGFVVLVRQGAPVIVADLFRVTSAVIEQLR